MIEIRNAKTGEAKALNDRQHVADFLAGRDDAEDWEGVSNLGPLPAPSVESKAYGPNVDAPKEIARQLKRAPVAKAAAKKPPAKKPAPAKKKPATKAGSRRSR